MKPEGGEGTIHVTLYVGISKTCPPRRGCPGQNLEACYCSLFDKELKRVPHTGRKHLYYKCGQCLGSMQELEITQSHSNRNHFTEKQRILPSVDIYPEESSEAGKGIG